MNKPRVDHVGVIVEDLDAAIDMFERLLGLAPSGRRELADVGLRIAEFEAENVAIELIQYTGRGDGFAAGVMGRRAGVNHVSFRVEDVEAAVKELEAGGVKVMAGFPRRGAHGPVAFFEPDTAQGLLFEVCERGRGPTCDDLDRS